MNITPEDFIYPIAGTFLGLLISIWLYIGFGNYYSLNFYSIIVWSCMIIGSIISLVLRKIAKRCKDE